MRGDSNFINLSKNKKNKKLKLLRKYHPRERRDGERVGDEAH